MKIHINKIALIIISLGISTSLLPFNAYAQSHIETVYLQNFNNNTNYTDITPFAPIIEWRYQVIDGKLYRRQYNYSTQEWIGKWELC